MVNCGISRSGFFLPRTIVFSHPLVAEQACERRPRDKRGTIGSPIGVWDNTLTYRGFVQQKLYV
jgi:hypothetical protein